MTTVPSATRVSTCRACGSSDLVDLFSLGSQHVSAFPLPQDVCSGERVAIELVQCSSCTLVQQRYSAPAELLYSRHYWYRSGTTDTMRRALANVVDAAMDRVRLRPGDKVLDVGSNDGTLLRQYPEELGLCRIGVEPATNLATRENYEDRGFGCIRDFWRVDLNPSPPPHQFKIITACGMMYDLEDPSAFLRATAAALHPDGVFVAQLQCLKQTVQLRDVGNFCHEHLEFYTLVSMVTMLQQVGLGIEKIEENDVNGGSYRLFIRHEDHETNEENAETLMYFGESESSAGLTNPDRLRQFGDKLKECMANLWQTVESIVRAGKTVWVYGASTKGNTILQTAGLDRQLIAAAADRSAEKVGRVTVGTGIPIRSEADFRAAQPDFALVLPYTFLPEFEEREREWRRRGGKWIIPIPDVKVV